MEKQKITVTVAGKPYTLVSEDPPEHVRRVAAYVDRTLSETAAATKLQSAQAAVLSCFRMAEELLKAQDENRMLLKRLEETGRSYEELREAKEAAERSSAGQPADSEEAAESSSADQPADNKEAAESSNADQPADNEVTAESAGDDQPADSSK